MKTFVLPFIILLIVCVQASAQQSDSVKYISLPPKDFDLTYQNDSKAVLIDVREQFEFRKSRLKGAVNIPSSGSLEIPSDTMNKEKSLFLYCTSGFRSKRVAKSFCEKGFAKVYSLEGGIVAWRKEKLPFDRSRRRKNK